ncbi:MAG: 2-dehydro-3-deoxygalactonokinase [Tagaea sp.]|nr:2-dehydro-3-deoxygalactonokinase [Tagaea sp.]
MSGLVAIDWGTTNVRAFHIANDGALLDRREKALGLQSVKNANFSGAFREIAGDWMVLPSRPRALLSGMIGSAQGWIEAPYVACPAAAAEIAGSLIAAPDPHYDIRVVPGLRCQGAGGPDVMRGEETQLIGAGLGDGVYCLPGTHSKWAIVEGGKVVRFATFMTGELFATARKHTILGRSMVDAQHDPAAFAQGYVRSTSPGGLLNHLFTVRTASLLEGLKPAAAPSYLSGLLIGHEIADAKKWCAPARVVVIGAGMLVQHYAVALAMAGVEAAAVNGEHAAAAGLYAIAASAGLIAQ